MVPDSNNSSEEKVDPGLPSQELMCSAFLFVHRGTTSEDESLKKREHLHTSGGWVQPDLKKDPFFI